MSKNKKLVPKRRFKEFQNSDAWEQRELGEVVQITMGQSPLGSNYTENPSDYILVQGNADMKNGKVFPRIWTTQVTKTAEPDDIILSVRAPVGDVGKTDYNVVLGRGVAGIKGNEFIYQLLSKMKSDSYWGKYSTGSTFDAINSNDLKEANICIPSTNEQVQIGSFFRNLDQTIAFQQRKLEKMKSMKSSYLSEMFPAEGERKPKRRFPGFTDDWEQRELSKIATMNARIGWQNLRTSEFLDEGNYMLITGTDFEDGKINYSTCHFVEKERYEQDKNIQIKNGSILITKDGTLGKVAYVEGLSTPATLNAGVFNVKIKNPLDADEKYLFQYLKAPFLMDYVNKRATGGTIKHLNQNILVDFPVLMPKKDEQAKIGDFFHDLDQTIAFQQQKLEKLQNIKKAYLNEMFI